MKKFTGTFTSGDNTDMVTLEVEEPVSNTSIDDALEKAGLTRFESLTMEAEIEVYDDVIEINYENGDQLYVTLFEMV